MSTHDGTEMHGTNVERVTDITEEEDQDPTTISVIKTEPKNCMGCLEGETGSCSETCVKCDVDGTEEISIKEEAIDIKDEIPEATFLSVKTENAVTLNEQLCICGAECRYSCDIHRGERPYPCEVCNKAFSEQSNLIRHQHIHSGEHPYTCEVCKKAFSRQSSLITHQRIHSGEHPYTCEVCNKAFKEQSNLIKHTCIHSGEDPYTCELCNKAFSRQSSLITRQRIHSGQRPYTCEVCNKAFSLKITLIRHHHHHHLFAFS